VHTHLTDCFESTPRLYFKSPEAGSGKTRALEVSEYLVARGKLAMEMSPAYLIRKISQKPQPTILYDEIDTVFGPKAKEHEDIRAVINSGHRQGASAGRCVAMGSANIIPIDLPCYGPVAMAGIGNLPDTIMDRAIVIAMKKRTSAEKVTPWRSRVDKPRAQALGKRVAAWADSVRKAALDYWPEMPDGVEDRDADRWEALIAVADLAGGRWPELARKAVLVDVADKSDEKESLGVLLLTDIQAVLKTNNHYAANGKPAMKTQALLNQLAKIDESPWGSINRDRSQLDARGLALRLRPYDIRPCDIRWLNDDATQTVSKGYYCMDFEDAWTRYVDLAATSATEPATTATSATDSGPSTSDVADVADVADKRKG
jgi:hypothetical protein